MTGILCHDHWKPYYQYGSSHALCNAHHLRELERAWEQDEQQWAQKMALLLKEINTATLDAGGHLDDFDAGIYRKRYRSLLEEADRECPAPDESQRKGRRGRLPRSKTRNLLERLRDFDSDVLLLLQRKTGRFSDGNRRGRGGSQRRRRDPRKSNFLSIQSIFSTFICFLLCAFSKRKFYCYSITSQALGLVKRIINTLEQGIFGISQKDAGYSQADCNLAHLEEGFGHYMMAQSFGCFAGSFDTRFRQNEDEFLSAPACRNIQLP